MIWFKLKKLEKKLAAGKLTEKAGMQYLLTWIVLLAILFYLPGSSSPYSTASWEFGAFILNLAIVLGTIHYLYKICHRNTKDNFLKKFISLSFVTGLRLLLVYSLLWLTYKIFMYNIPDELFLSITGLWIEDVGDLLLSLILTTTYAVLLIKSFKRVNRENFAKNILQIKPNN